MEKALDTFFESVFGSTMMSVMAWAHNSKRPLTVCDSLKGDVCESNVWKELVGQSLRQVAWTQSS
jgi:hypothetical protein